MARRLAPLALTLAAALAAPAPALATHGGGAPNDSRATPLVVSGDQLGGAAGPVDDQTASTELGEPLTVPNDGVGCRDDGTVGIGGSDMKRTVWFQFVAPATGPMLVSARGSVRIPVPAAPAAPHDVVVAIYDTPAAATAPIACGHGPAGDRPAGEVEFHATANRTYWAQVGAWHGFDDGDAATEQATSPHRGDVTFATAPALAQDARASAVTLVPNETRLGDDNLGAGIDADADGNPTEDTFCDDGGARAAPLGSTVWYRLVVPSISDVTLTAGTFDTVLQLYAGDAPSPFACNDDAAPGDRTARIARTALAPGTYVIQVGGWRGTQGRALRVRADVVDRDVDRDGFAQPADCDDRRPDVHPGAPETVDNGVDDDCDGVSATTPAPPPPAVPPQAPQAPPASDRDGDGVADASDDCPREDARAGDRNRNGCLDGSVTTPGTPALRVRQTAGGVRVLALTVAGTARGSRVAVACTRRACRGQAIESRGGRVAFRRLRGARLRAGSTLSVRLTRPGAHGRVVRFRIARGGYRRSERCVPLGRTAPALRCGS